MKPFILSHTRLIDPKSFRGQMTIPFEFGIQALASRYYHPFGAIVIRLLPSLSLPMDPKSSQGQRTRLLEFGM